MRNFFKLIFLFIIFCVSAKNIFAESLGLSTYGIDLLNPTGYVDYKAPNSDSAASFLGVKVSSGVNIIIGFVALAVFLLVLYGGIVILFSNGNADSYKTGLNIIKTTIIGLIIIIFSYAIVSFFVKNVFSTTEPETPQTCASCNTRTQYCCTSNFFNCGTKGICKDILINDYCSCSGSDPSTCQGVCTPCSGGVCPTTNRVLNYSGYCTPEKTENSWYCKKR